MSGGIFLFSEGKDKRKNPARLIKRRERGFRVTRTGIEPVFYP